jgi:CRISPR/Cas system-associated exonuclease Cas4 (RecB family)
LEDFYVSKNYDLDFMENKWDVVCKEGYIEKNGHFVSPILSDPYYDFPKGEEEKKMLYYHGRKLLREYYHKNKHAFGLSEVVATEFNFRVEVGGGKVVLNGYIDRIDRMPDGKLFIVDYKTGKEKDKEGVDSDFQLSLYSFAIRKTFGEVEGGLCLHYIKSGNVLVSQRNKDDFDKLLERVKFVKRGIEMESFEAKKGEQCKYCLYECPLGINNQSRELYLKSIEEKNIDDF